MRSCSEDAPRTGERNVNFNKNTSENAVLNKMCKPDERAPSFIFKQKFWLLNWTQRYGEKNAIGTVVCEEVNLFCRNTISKLH